MILTLVLLTPLVGSLALLFMDDTNPMGAERVKRTTLLITVITFMLAVLLWGGYDASSGSYQYVQQYATVSYLQLHVGVDGLSLWYVLLTAFLTPVCVLASWDNVRHGLKAFMAAQLLIEGLLLTLFCVLDLLLFYVAFEAVLVPLFLVVGVWGGSASRVRAALLLFLYTLAGSLFMLLAFVSILRHTGTTDLTVLTLTDLAPSVQRMLWLGIAIALAVKTPLVPFHMWLPRAHSEAPLAGSMVLAGTVLKASTYGCLRVLIPLLPDATAYFAPLVHTIALVTLVYASLATMRQTDLKALVAYSSIAHMAVVTLGLFSNTIIGIEGAILLSLAHGVVSPALFAFVGGVLYDRYHTRVLRYYRGLTLCMPVGASLFFIATCCNMGVPLSLNWLGELMSLSGVYQQSPLIGGFAASTIVLSACYSIWLWSRLCTGAWTEYLPMTTDVTRRELCVLLPLLVAAVLLGVLPNIVLDDLHANVAGLLYSSP